MNVTIYDTNGQPLSSVAVNIIGAVANTAPVVGDSLLHYDLSATANRQSTLEQLLKGALDSATSEATIADGDELLIKDASANALRRMTKANFTTGLGGSGFAGECCSLYKTSDQSIPNTTWTALLWEAEIDDPDGMHSTVTNTSRVTVVNTGHFLVSLGVYINDSSYCDFAVYKNGSLISNTIVTGWVAGNFVMPHFSWIVSATAGDYLEIFVYTTYGPVTLNSGPSGRSGTVRPYRLDVARVRA